MTATIMELASDLAIEIVEKKYGENTYEINFNGDVYFSEDAQDYFNEVYGQIETLCENF